MPSRAPVIAALVLLAVHAAVAFDPSQNMCVLQLSSASPSACVAPGDCNYECARTIGLVGTGDDEFEMRPRRVTGCECDVGTGSYQSSTLAEGSYPGADFVLNGNGTHVQGTVTRGGFSCQTVYSVASGNCLGVAAGTPAAGTCTVSLASASPSSCVSPSSCDYRCAQRYAISPHGSIGAVLQPSEVDGCSCKRGYALMASETSSHGWYTSTNVFTSHRAAGANRITVVTRVNPSLECTAQYSVVQGTCMGLSSAVALTSLPLPLLAAMLALLSVATRLLA